MQVWSGPRWRACCDRVRQTAAIHKRKCEGKATNAPLPLQSKALLTIAKVRETKSLASLRMPAAWWHRFGVPTTRCTTKTRLATPFKHKKIRRTPFTQPTGSSLYSNKPDRHLGRNRSITKTAPCRFEHSLRNPSPYSRYRPLSIFLFVIFSILFFSVV